MKVLLLSASTGNGHMSAARAIEAELKARGHDATTVDVLDHTGKGFRGWYRGGYEVLVRKKPQLWGRLYKASDRKLFSYYFQTGLDHTFVGRMRRYFETERPDWALCTHSLPQPALARWRKRTRFKIGVVVTDLYPQLMWLRGDPDWFFVPGEWSLSTLIERHPRAKGRTTVTGIPIDPVFAAPQGRSEARKAMGLDPDKRTVLVTSGGIGGGPMGEVATALRSLEGDFQAVLVCGRSEAAVQSANAAAQGDRRLQIKGHQPIEAMAGFMHASDLIVAKPGGITTFEALASGLPFVVFEPFLIPGQEELNAEFLVDEGIGVRVGSASDLGSVLGGLLSDDARRSGMSAQALVHARPRAAREIVTRLEELA
ncbi:MAG: hypothetical protein JST30_14755 [Armatimonadetes bacterium]|nr:hypothetical protein [Armatimonadota bacterium]